MITSFKHKAFLIFFLSVVGIFSIQDKVTAQESQILSVTPPLFQLSVAPGDVWQSNLKVVNGNPYSLTIYAEVVNFSATGEDGRGNFTPILSVDDEGDSLANWIEISEEPHVIPPEQTRNISFFVDVPENAPPGGHYAAILISTEASGRKDGDRLAVQTSQAVTSLFFIRIEGEIEELGAIREFSVTDSFLDKPDAEFSLRFENKGNVHLQPRGDIIITNMWGTERGKIPINYQTNFGNVLPRSIRDFRFQWESDFQITDIGRYTAEAVLSFGKDGRKSVNAKTYFWIIPVKATFFIVSILFLFLSLIVLMVKTYIRKALTLAGVDSNRRTLDDRNDEKGHSIIEPHLSYVSAPLKNGVLDLRTKLNAANESADTLRTIVRFVVDYKKFFISIVALTVIFITTVMYISSATEINKDYTILIKEGEMEISDE